MPKDDYCKIFEVINEVFSLRTDAEQLQVTDLEQKELAALHPACLSGFCKRSRSMSCIICITPVNPYLKNHPMGEYYA